MERITFAQVVGDNLLSDTWDITGINPPDATLEAMNGVLTMHTTEATVQARQAVLEPDAFYIFEYDVTAVSEGTVLVGNAGAKPVANVVLSQPERGRLLAISREVDSLGDATFRFLSSQEPVDATLQSAAVYPITPDPIWPVDGIVTLEWAVGVPRIHDRLLLRYAIQDDANYQFVMVERTATSWRVDVRQLVNGIEASLHQTNTVEPRGLRLGNGVLEIKEGAGWRQLDTGLGAIDHAQVIYTPAFHPTYLSDEPRNFTLPKPVVLLDKPVNVPRDATLSNTALHMTGQGDRLVIAGDNVVFDGLSITGENQPFDKQYVQNQSASIRVNAANFTLRHSDIRHLFGFPIAGTGKGVIEDNHFEQIGNGVNILYGTIRNNTLIDTEGIEFSRPTLCEGNTISCQRVRRFGTISAGGKQSGDPEAGLIVRDNQSFNTEFGVNLKERTIDLLIEGHLAVGCDYGIHCPPNVVQVINPVIRRCTIETAQIVGISLVGEYTNALIEDCAITDSPIGIRIYGAGGVVIRNMTFSGNGVDIYLDSSARNVMIENCPDASIQAEDGAEYTVI